MRKEIKKPITAKGLKIALGKLNKWALDDLTKIDIVNQSIERSWSGLFPLNKNNNLSSLLLSILDLPPINQSPIRITTNTTRNKKRNQGLKNYYSRKEKYDN